jgi:hypothetical protein
MNVTRNGPHIGSRPVSPGFVAGYAPGIAAGGYGAGYGNAGYGNIGYGSGVAYGSGYGSSVGYGAAPGYGSTIGYGGGVGIAPSVIGGGVGYVNSAMAVPAIATTVIDEPAPVGILFSYSGSSRFEYVPYQKAVMDFEIR